MQPWSLRRRGEGGNSTCDDAAHCPDQAVRADLGCLFILMAPLDRGRNEHGPECCY